MASDRSLHMAALLPHWDENFIINAFAKMGEYVLRVEMRTGEGRPASFCFVEFLDGNSAAHAMHKLHGKWIPDSIPPAKFHLDWKSEPGEHGRKEFFTLFVGYLPPDVDNYLLYKGFASRYPSVRLAKVLRDDNGNSKKCGIVGFAKENEQKDALINMNGFLGFGSRPIRVEPKRNKYSSPRAETSSSLVQHMTANSAIRSGQPQSSISATNTQPHINQYNMQYRQNYSSPPAASENYGNSYTSIIPWDNYAQQQPSPFQHVGQQQPNPRQSTRMPAANIPPQMMTPPMGMQMAHSFQHVGQQQPNTWQTSMMPTAYQDPAQPKWNQSVYRLPSGASHRK